MCIGCHGIPGYQASFPEVHKVPMISGQNAELHRRRAAAYSKGDRKHPTMRSIAASLTDQDIADIAAFYERQGRVEGTTVPAAAAAPPSTAVAALLQKGACVSLPRRQLQQADRRRPTPRSPASTPTTSSSR